VHPLQQVNSGERARRNIVALYDLSDVLYLNFLDEDRQYSCAYFPTEEMSLEDAQRAQKAHIAAKLLLRPGQRVLDIGCGWGGLALTLAHTGQGPVTGITLSAERLAAARRRAEAGGHADRHLIKCSGPRSDHTETSSSATRRIVVPRGTMDGTSSPWVLCRSHLKRSGREEDSPPHSPDPILGQPMR
jgi:cyclopropane fatty-acyl-phospholipid synthase-like methyltransferase